MGECGNLAKVAASLPTFAKVPTMAEFPALPLFTDAYMADTRHLSAAQHGAYLLLLMTAWRMPDCKLPDDDVFLSRCASMDSRSWKTNRDVIMAFWKQDEQKKWYQGRLLDERKYVDDRRHKNSQAGKSSALKRLNRGSTTVPTKRQPESNPHTHTQIKKEKINNKSTLFDELPDWLPVQDWNDYLDMRKAIKKPATDRAKQMALKTLIGLKMSGESPAACLQQSIMKNYTDIYAVNKQKKVEIDKPKQAHMRTI